MQGSADVCILTGLIFMVNLRILNSAGTGVSKQRDVEFLMFLPTLATVASRDPPI